MKKLITGEYGFLGSNLSKEVLKRDEVKSTKISFCIPTLNRPEYLLRCINSICVNDSYSDKFELCIFNNFSDDNYCKVENLIDKLKAYYNIKYIKSNLRVSIDESMFNAISMATGDYLFFLGDDDFILDGSINYLLNLVEVDYFDLAVCNAIIIDEKKSKKIDMFNRNIQTIRTFRENVLFLKNFCSFGNIIVNSKFISEKDFTYLIGTSHAYGSFWLEFFRQYENGLQPKIEILNNPIVCLGVTYKSYNLLKVAFLDFKTEMDLYYGVIGPKGVEIIKEYEKNHFKKQSSFKQLYYYISMGCDLDSLIFFNNKFYKENYLKIFFLKRFFFLYTRLKLSKK